jgi:hypothetical protein
MLEAFKALDAAGAAGFVEPEQAESKTTARAIIRACVLTFVTFRSSKLSRRLVGV